jgi:predicted O-methyltransferase YrrM
MIWSAVDAYIVDLLVGDDPGAAGGLPPHEVAPNQGKLLYLLARMCGARRILELGTLGGYSAIWLARALPEGGSLTTLEIDAGHAGTARANLEQAGVAERVEVRVGPALETLDTLEGPFDLIFIDADKRSNAEYLERALNLSRPGTVIVADNVVRDGAILDADSEDPSVRGVRRFFELVAAEPRLEATAIQTVGSKGHDGFAVALVVEPPDAGGGTRTPTA